MFVRSLHLRDFRSWPELALDLEPGVTVFVGRNGFGKTNIVEAIGYLAHLSSHRVSHDAPLVRAGSDSARISATAVNDGRELTAHLLLKPHAANQAQLNRTKLKSPREILGVVKSVLFAPEDLALVRGEPAERRRYLDAILATRGPRVAAVKADYDRVVKQRNALLKTASAALRRGYDDVEGGAALSTLDVWDAQLSQYGGQLVAHRLQLIDDLANLVEQAYSQIAPESRRASISYKSSVDGLGTDAQVNEAMLLAALGASRQREIERGVSLVGPHRDDLELNLGDQPAKGFASHGETWTFALSLRIAEFNLLRNDGTDPILILDDVFAELDAKRRRALVGIAAGVEQVLITAAVDDDLPDNLGDAKVVRHTVTTQDLPDGGRISVLDND